MGARKKADDGPKIKMRVTPQGLQPLSQYDAELLASWRNGVEVEVEVSLAQSRWKERKYRAMLKRLMDAADTGWENMTQAHSYLKTEFEFVTPIFRAGAWTVEPMSMSQMTDEQLDEFYEKFIGKIHEFGIDPETLNKESADTGHVDRKSETLTAMRTGAPLKEDAHSATEKAVEDDPPDEVVDVAEVDAAWLAVVARMLYAATEPGGDPGIVLRQAKAIREHHTPHEVSQLAKDKATAIKDHCLKATTKEIAFSPDYMAGLAGITVADMRRP